MKPTELFLEIDYNLKSLQDFWDKLWGELETGPISIAYGLKRLQQRLTNNPSSKEVRVIDEVYYFTEDPNWHRKIFDNLKSFSSLSGEEQQGVRQFYDNLRTITTDYGHLRDSRSGATNLPELVNKLKEIVTETLEIGNPLKGTQALTALGSPPDSFLLKARQEVQVIYDYIKNCGGLLTSPSELKHKKALKCFQRDKKNFKVLTIKDLDDIAIYNATSHPDREIMGRILDRIVLRKKYISNGSQKLFEKSQKLRKIA